MKEPLKEHLNQPIVIRDDTYLNKTEILNNYGIIYKKYENEFMEVNTYVLFSGQRFYLTNPKEGGIKTYAVISGQLNGAKEGEFYRTGDLIILHHNDEKIYVYAESDVKLIVTSFGDKAFQENERRFQLVSEVMKSIQDKDAYTMDHCIEVSDIFREVAFEAGWEGNRLINAIVAAKYHDIGKVLTPEDILNKPQKLDENEFEIMKRHVIDCIKFLNGYITEDVLEIILQHHERLNGSGYPNHLDSTHILEEAKALAVVDSYHAMRSERIYKKGMSKEEALEELRSLSGTFYDEKYVELLIKVLDKNPRW